MEIKKKGDEVTKLKAIEKKIEIKNATYKKINQLYSIAKESVENLISKKGMDLIKEWGFMSRKAKITYDSKGKAMDKNEEEKHSPTSKLNKSNTITLSNQKPTVPTIISLGLKASPSKFKKAQEDNKRENSETPKVSANILNL